MYTAAVVTVSDRSPAAEKRPQFNRFSCLSYHPLESSDFRGFFSPPEPLNIGCFKAAPRKNSPKKPFLFKVYKNLRRISAFCLFTFSQR